MRGMADTYDSADLGLKAQAAGAAARREALRRAGLSTEPRDPAKVHAMAKAARTEALRRAGLL